MKKYDWTEHAAVTRAAAHRAQEYLNRKEQQRADRNEQIYGTLALLCVIAGFVYFMYA